MKEKPKIVYTTAIPDRFPISQENEISEFRKNEISEKTFLSKRSKSVKIRNKRNPKRHGKVNIMKRSDTALLNSTGMRILSLINQKSLTSKEVAEELNITRSAALFHLTSMNKCSNNMVNHIKDGEKIVWKAKLPKNATSVESEYLLMYPEIIKNRKNKKKIKEKIETKLPEPLINVSILDQINKLLNRIESFKSIDIDVNINIKINGDLNGLFRQSSLK